MVMITEGVARALSNGTPRKGKPTDRHAANRFYVEVGKTKATSDCQAVFSEGSGLKVEMQVTDCEEGGENNFVHRLPGRLKVSNIPLKRGLEAARQAMHEVVLAAL